VIQLRIINGPEITEIKERNVACVSFIGNYLGNAEVFRGLFEKLCGWAFDKQLMGSDTVLLSAYYDDQNVTPPEKLRLDVCMTIQDDVEVDGEIKKKKLPGGTYAVMRVELTGAEEYGPAWGMIHEWVTQNNLTIDLSRASYEVYLNNPEEHPEKYHVLDICLSVE